jgi:beta-glucosidase
MPGQESGRALMDILYGDVNPSGRLPYTVARNESDYGDLLYHHNGTGDVWSPQDDFSEGHSIDCRAFDRDTVAPRYGFGFGLSYTTFAYADLVVLPLGAAVAGLPDADVPVVKGGHPQLWENTVLVTFTLTNTGDVDGSEVAQLYLGIPYDATTQRQLRGFDKVWLAAGETKSVTITLTRRDISFWDVVSQQ